MNAVEDIKRAVAKDAADFAAWLFPAGRRNGQRCKVGDVSGAPGESLEIQLDGEFAGSFHDWATNERGDCIALVMAARGLDFANAVRLLRERYGLATRSQPSGGTACRLAAFTKATATPKHESQAERLPTLPTLERGNRGDLLRLSSARNLAPAALDLAGQRGLLWFYDSREGRAWLITDHDRRNAQSRRLDGRPWDWNGKKAWTHRGSWGKWPIGLPESAAFPAIAFCEGGPDFLAAFHHAHASGRSERIAPVCLLGATMPIGDDRLPAFAGKYVRIFVHDDDEGMAAARRWAHQLNGVVARVDGFTFDGLRQVNGQPVKDLCEMANVDVDSWEAYRDIENCMAFAVEGRAK